MNRPQGGGRPYAGKTYKFVGETTEHKVIAEQAIGKLLPPGAEVHHFNEVKSDNSRTNLVICPNHAYHRLLHARQRALEACGHADWMKCPFCKQYDDPVRMVRVKAVYQAFHRACKNSYKNDRRLRFGRKPDWPAAIARRVANTTKEPQ